MQQIAAHAGIGQTRHDPHLVIVFSQTIAIFLNTEVVIQIFDRNIDALNLFLNDFGDSFAGQFADLTLQIPHPRLAGIGADHFLQRLRLQSKFRGLQPMVFHLLRDQMTMRNLSLFLFGVARQGNDFHAVQQGARHVIAVGCGQEHHIRQIIFHLQIMIHEGRVLLWIQHLQHRRGGIAPKILTHFVDLIQQDQRIGGFGLFQRLNNFTGHRANVSPAVTANFAFITHPAQRDTNKFAPRGFGN